MEQILRGTGQQVTRQRQSSAPCESKEDGDSFDG